LRAALGFSCLAFRFARQTSSDRWPVKKGLVWPDMPHAGASPAGIAVALAIEYRMDRTSGKPLGVMYPDPKSSSQKLYDRALSSLPGGNTRTTVFMKPYPIYAARGEGCRVFDVDGNSYIDCINNFTSLIHGHAHPVLIEAATRQLALGSAFGMPTVSEVELAELIAARLPSVEQVRFTNSGTEAVMMALKAARAFTGRPKIAKCEGAYHGSYDYAEVSLDPTPDIWGRNAPVSVAYAKGTPEKVLSDVVTIPFNDAE